MNKEDFPLWAKELNCAITICDTQGNVIYANDKSLATFASHGNIVGTNLKHCHQPASWEKIMQLLREGGTNSYTILKKGEKKLIYQTAWKQDGIVAGLVEFSLVIPLQMPHYDRDAAAKPEQSN